MIENRLDDYLAQIADAARNALGFVEDLTYEHYLSDVRTQQAVALSLILIGEAATRVGTLYPDFSAQTPQVNWRQMRGMRHHIAHGYYTLDLAVIWDTVQNGLPNLIDNIRAIRSDLPVSDSEY